VNLKVWVTSADEYEVLGALARLRERGIVRVSA